MRMETQRSSVNINLPGDPHAPRKACHLVTIALEPQIPDAIKDTLSLLISEVVTNSVIHSHSSEQATIRVRCTIDQEAIRFQCFDNGTGFSGEIEAKDPTKPGGWGLVLVDRLAQRWGAGLTKRSDESWCVWFDLPNQVEDLAQGHSSSPHASARSTSSTITQSTTGST